jgi:hypothetical protein
MLMAKIKEALNPKNPATQRVLLIGGMFILGFVLFAIAGIQFWEWSNRPAFCTDVCHDVHPEEPAAYQDSYHARVKCVECHMGRVSTLRNMVLKASHFRHLPQTLLGQYTHPERAETLRPANESCERCHWPPSFHHDTVLQIRHFEPDEQNTEEHTYLILRTGGGELERGLGYGIHWHIENPVEYIATDERRQDIPWVRATFPDGRMVEYNDVINPLSAEEIATAEPRVMDCVDCHNQMGHPFYSPEKLLDMAMAEGELSTDLPYAKKELKALLSATYSGQEEALAAVDLWAAQYQATYPDAAATYATEVEQATELAGELLTRLVFEEPGVTWQSFPDNGGHGGHKDFPGCFRCHDGKHLSAEGESIRLHCNICHSIPVKVDPEDRPPQVPTVYLQQPPWHEETNFMADHRFQANSACTECHGEIAFGSDDSSFCANSACHGQAWPSVNLDAAFPHPIELEGKHAEVWCHDCHEGIQKPSYECAACHDPPMASHFGPDCEDCHTPDGFEQATMVASFEHPAPLEGAHATLDCLECHASGESLAYECVDCHQPPSEPHFGPDCEGCHTPTSFKGATIPPELHPIPLVGAHLRATCEVCHAEGERVPEYVCGNCHRPPDNHLEGACDACHTPEGWSESAASFVTIAPQIPHGVDELDYCLVCHSPDLDAAPVPDGHVEQGYGNEQCRLCHKAAP